MMQEVKIGHYTLGKTIGSGGFAKVKKAKHDLTGLQVAVKIINKKKMKNKNMISKVKRQIKILKFINHPNIIKLYEVLDTTNDIFVIMQLASKGQLYQNIQNSTINQNRARFYFKQIINGIQYIHQNHITHRDLKPQNILIDQNDLIKIGDFGLSNLMKDGKLLKTSCGSLSYAAPQIVGQRKYEGTSIDIWSTGVILYALLAGSLPFDEDNITLLHKKIQQGSYKKIPNTVSYEAKDLIQRMLQVDPRKRIKISQIKFHPWITSQMPIYSKITDQFLIQKIHQFEVDEDILKQVKNMNLGFHQFSQEKVRKSIMKRDDHSFVIAYQLLKSQKDRKLYAEVQEDLLKPGNAIFENIPNNHLPQSLETIDTDDKRYTYGQIVRVPLKPLIQTIKHLLDCLSIEYIIKSPDYCLKCCYKKRSDINEQEEKQQKMDKQQTSEEQKFSKKIIKFILQIYAVNKEQKMHVVDLQLTQGHPFIFFPLARKIYKELS